MTKKLTVIFYTTEFGIEIVREWILSLPAKSDRQKIGDDIRTIQYGWPLGMPACRPMGDGLFEVRTNLEGHRIARVIFFFDGEGLMVLLHGFIKKTRTTPNADLDIARNNRRSYERRQR